jgi:hypothetical protein
VCRRLPLLNLAEDRPKALWRGRRASVKISVHATVSACARFDWHLVKRNSAPVAQMDRATASEAVGREFDPHRARHFNKK